MERTERLRHLKAKVCTLTMVCAYTHHTPHTPRPNSYVSFSVADFEKLKERLMQTEQELQNARCVVCRGGADCCMYI